jgi:hypothetical protein
MAEKSEVELMETLVEEFVSEYLPKLGIQYMTQANCQENKRLQWNIDIQVDKSSRNWILQ